MFESIAKQITQSKGGNQKNTSGGGAMKLEQKNQQDENYAGCRC